jgi:phosphohistidine phosphatase SixA
MTEPDVQLDELVSAYLDGEATPEERVLVESDPRAQARLAELTSASAAMRRHEVALPDADTRDALLARVLEQSQPEAVVVTHRRWTASPALFAAAAAVIAIAFLAGALTLLGRDGDDSDNASSTAALTTAAGGSGGGSTAADAAAPERQSAPAAGNAGSQASTYFSSDEAVLPDLGSFVDVASLRTAVGAVPSPSTSGGAATTSEAAATPPSPGCAAVPAAQRYRALLGGQAVLVVINGEVATVVDAASCRVVTQFVP